MSMSKICKVVITKVYSFIVNTKYKENLFKMPFYAVAKGRTPGIFMNWTDCEAQVKGFSGARYKKFDTALAAEEFIKTIQGNTNTNATFKATTKYLKANHTDLVSNNNLKRPYSTASSSAKQFSDTIKKKKSPLKEQDNSDDELNEILNKQLDDVEKKLKGVERNVDKIVKNSVKNSRKAIMIEPPQPKKRRTSSQIEFQEDQDGYVNVYTDGSCTSNGKYGAKAGIGVYWGEGHPLNISEPVAGRATNNVGEIQAATKAMKLALQNGVKKVSINTDSKFLINSVTKWIPGWKTKGWRLKSGEPVKNEDDFKDLESVRNKLQVKWNYVEAHRGVHGNEMADQLAKAGAAMYSKK